MFDSSSGKSLAKKLAGTCAFTAACLLSLSAIASETMTLKMQTPKDYFRESCFALEIGQRLAYKLSTPNPIEFNLHHHRPDGQMVYPDRLVVKSQHEKQMIVQSAGVYCFMATSLADQPGPFDVVINYEITAR